MKKYILSIAATALCILSAYADSITVADVSLSPDEPQSVSINLTNTETNLVSFQMDLTLPEGITINKSGCSLSGRFPNNQELTIGRQSNGTIRLTSTSFNLTPIAGTSGEIITLSLTASADSEGGTATISNIRLVTSNSERITPADATFSISIASASPIITFADANVKAICVANWDTNHDSELSEEEAAAVTSLGEVFKGNTSITSFNELQYFTGLTSISLRAFGGCSSLTSITIPDGVTTISMGAFSKCSSLTSITIPNSVTSIGSGAFGNCSSLTSITIPNSVTNIGEYAFRDCSSLTSVNIPNNVTSIGQSAFAETAWYNAQPDGILYLDDWLIGYKGNKPTGNVTINNGTRGIAATTFWCCSNLTSVTIPNSVTIIGNSAFSECSGLTSITIPNSVINMGSFTFYKCSGLTSVTIPEGVTSIGQEAFEYCSSLTSVNIPNNVTYIEQYAFAGCTSLTSVTIPNSVTNIHSYAFAYCSGLTDVYCYAEDVPSTHSTAFTDFTDSSASATLHVPAGSLEAYSTTAPWSGFGSIRAIEVEYVTNLLSNKWSGAEYSVQAATFDSGVNYGDWNDSNPNYNQIVGVPEADANGRNWYDVDYTCNWQEMTAPLNNWCQDGNFGDIYARRTFYYDEEMPEELFLACGHDDAPCEYYLNGELIWSVTDGWFEQEIYKLTSAQKALLRPGELNVLAFHVHQNYGGMYADCGLYTSLSEMGISNKCGDNLTWSFDYDTGTLTISGTGDMYDFSYYSEDIPNTPWVGIRNLIKHIDVQDGATRIGSDAFLECSALTSVTLPNSVTSIGGNAFRGCTALTSVTIPEGVTTIGNSAFRDSGLETIAFPNSLTSILRDAFDWCMALTSITIPKSVTRIDASTFQGCQGLTSIIVEEGNPTYDSRDNCNAIIETATNTLIAGCQNTIIPESVTSIGGCAFEGGCTGPTTFINIPEGVTSIWCWGFHGCGLTSVTIPNSVTLIDHDAFQSCDIMTDLTIGSGVTNIRNSAFSYCSALTDVWCNAENVPTTENDAFNNSPIASATLHVPAASLEAYSNTAPWSGFGTIVAIGDDVEKEEQTLSLASLPAMTYGDAAYTLPAATTEGQALTWTSSNTSVATISGNTLSIKSAGTATITATQAGGNLYLPFSREFSLTIAKAMLTVTAQSCSKQEGEENPVLTVTYSGFKYDDDASVLTTQPIVTTTATASSPVGSYPITVSGAEAANYNFTYVAGTLTVVDETALDNTLAALDAKGLVGSKTTLAIALTNANDVSLCQFDLRLPEDVTVALNARNKLDATLTDRASTHTISSRQLSNGDYRFVVSSNDGDSFVGNEGTLMNIVMDIAEDAEAGNRIIRVLNIELSLPEGNDLKIVNPADAESTLTISSYKPGDVNGDDKVSVTDVGYAINYILEQVPSVFIFDAADMNHDGKISVTDVGYIINIILSDEGPSHARRKAAAQNMQQDGIATLAQSGTEHRLYLDAENCIGFQMDVMLPQGIELSAARLDAMSCADHTLTFRQVAENKYRILCYSPTNSTLNRAADALLSLTTTAATDGMTVTDILFTTASLDEVAFVIGDDATGIASMGADGKDAMYDLQGRRVDSNRLHKGIYLTKGRKSVKK